LTHSETETSAKERIFERLKKVSEPKKLRELPPEMTFIVLDEIAGRLADLTETMRDIKKHLTDTLPEGIDIPFDDQVVTGITTIDLIKNYPYRPMRSVDFFNKGPDTAYYKINEDGKEIKIENRESITVDRRKATITYITLRVVSGASATIRLIGHY